MTRYLLRVEGSGVWLDCELLDPLFPGTMRWRGRRAHFWRGAIDASALANQGPRVDSRITEETEVFVPERRLIEAQPMNEQAIEATRAVPVAKVT